MRWQIVLRGIGAMIIGYAVIVLITANGFNFVHGKDPLWGSSPVILFQATMVAIVAGLTGGFIAGWIGAGRGLINAALVLLPLAIDTIYVLFFFKGTAPWWFDAIGSGTLMACTLLGGLLSQWSPRAKITTSSR